MKLKDYSVAKRWKEFKMIPASAYDVFVLMYNRLSDEDEAHLDGAYDSVEVFRDFVKAEEHIDHLLYNKPFKGFEVYDVDFIDDRFIYKATDETKTYSAVFEIRPTKFAG